MTTDRLIVRRPHPADLASFLAYRQEAGADPSGQTTMTEEAARALLARQSEPWRPDGQGVWRMLAIERRDGARGVIGEVGAFLDAREEQGDLGWIVAGAHRGQGVATEAARVLLRHLFEERGLHRVTAGCEASNAGSWRVMERLGMRRESATLQSRRLPGGWRDEFGYAMLREEWMAASRADGRR